MNATYKRCAHFQDKMSYKKVKAFVCIHRINKKKKQLRIPWKILKNIYVFLCCMYYACNFSFDYGQRLVHEFVGRYPICICRWEVLVVCYYLFHVSKYYGSQVNMRSIRITFATQEDCTIWIYLYQKLMSTQVNWMHLAMFRNKNSIRTAAVSWKNLLGSFFLLCIEGQ